MASYNQYMNGLPQSQRASAWQSIIQGNTQGLPQDQGGGQNLGVGLPGLAQSPGFQNAQAANGGFGPGSIKPYDPSPQSQNQSAANGGFGPGSIKPYDPSPQSQNQSAANGGFGPGSIKPYDPSPQSQNQSAAQPWLDPRTGTPSGNAPPQAAPNLGLGGGQSPAQPASTGGGNPYLGSQANAITQTSTQNLQNNILPGVRAGAMAAGGYGGSRQGIAEANAIWQTNQGISNSLASMYGNAYQADQANATQASIAAGNNATQQQIARGQLGLGYTQAANQYGLGQGQLALGNMQANQNYGLGMGNLGLGYQNSAQNYNLGLGNLGLGYQNSDNNYNLGLGQLQNTATANDQNFYTNQRGQDLTQQNQGFNQYLSSLYAQLGMGSAETAIGQQQQQAPYTALTNYSNSVNPLTGLNQSGTSNTTSGGGIAGAVGGALTAAQLWNLIYGKGG